MAQATGDIDREHADALGRRYLIKFEEDTLKSRPLWIRIISGASMNPARSLGPDIVANDYTGWWVYLTAPVIGAAIAVIIITAVRGVPERKERDAAQGGELPQ